LIDLTFDADYISADIFTKFSTNR